MNSVKISLVALLLFVSALSSKAQVFQVPIDYSLVVAEDYARYEKDIIACVNWLESIPLNRETDKRKAASAFLVAWITGSPTVTIQLKEYLNDFTEANPELLLAFLGGYTKFVLENPKSNNEEVLGNLSGIKSVIKVYKQENGNMKSKVVDKLIKLDEKGELQKWVEGKVK